jgi:hypothetical protein
MRVLIAALTWMFVFCCASTPKYLLNLSAKDLPNSDSVQYADAKLTICVEDVGRYMSGSDAPTRKGVVKFRSNGEIQSKNGAIRIEADCLHSYNGFDVGYILRCTIRKNSLHKSALDIRDLNDVEITYTDDFLAAKGLSERDVEGLIQQLKEPHNKVQFHGSMIPGGELLEFSAPMKKLIILGAKARAPLQKCLSDKEIQNEAALVLGAIGDESTVPILIDLYPDHDARKDAESMKGKPERDNPRVMMHVCMNFALAYLTGQSIGRSRTGADLKPENRKLWEEWWAKEKTNFKVPQTKPNASWVPMYPVLSEKWARSCRERFANEPADK